MDALLESLTQSGAHRAPEGAPLPILTHGDVPAEYAAATEGWALFARPDLETLALQGADAQAFLARILAGDLRALASGHSQRNLLLTPKGKVQHLFEITRTTEGYLITTPPGRAAALQQGLDTYHFGEDIQWPQVSESFAYIEVVGPQAQAQLSQALACDLDLAAGAGRFAGDPWSTVFVSHTPVAGHPGWRLQVPRERATALWDHLVERGARPAGLIAFDSLRAESATPVWGVDIDDSVYPQEARLDDAFSLSKGCYIGQEVVAKIDTYGGLNKRLMLLAVSDDDPVPAGTRLLQRDAKGEMRDLGVVTTWAYSFARDGGVVLAYVKRKHQAEGTRFQLGESERTATILVPPGEPASEDSTTPAP